MVYVHPSTTADADADSMDQDKKDEEEARPTEVKLNEFRQFIARMREVEFSIPGEMSEVSFAVLLPLASFLVLGARSLTTFFPPSLASPPLLALLLLPPLASLRRPRFPSSSLPHSRRRSRQIIQTDFVSRRAAAPSPSEAMSQEDLLFRMTAARWVLPSPLPLPLLLPLLLSLPSPEPPRRVSSRTEPEDETRKKEAS